MTFGGSPFAATAFGGAPAVLAVYVTVALTGQSLSVAQGSVLSATTLAFSGQALTVTQGSLLPATTLAFSGHSMSVAGGSLLFRATGWTSINDAQTPAWSDIDDAQTPNWVVIPT